ncbi:MAG: GNAT family N-acetyltransferase [Marinibacterium sp.]|nr:GNAT family N-acetyltransferase [Marinibacterium sp.]
MQSGDVPAACAILCEIIEIGGTAAIEDRPDPDTFANWYLGPDLIANHVALAADGTVLGFQWLGRNPQLPPDCADIATFARRRPVTPGVGRALFAATVAVAAARAQGLGAINATIRADNAPGLGYYSKMGFVDHAVARAVPLKDGTPVDRLSKRFDLDVAV